MDIPHDSELLNRLGYRIVVGSGVEEQLLDGLLESGLSVSQMAEYVIEKGFVGPGALNQIIRGVTQQLESCGARYFSRALQLLCVADPIAGRHLSALTFRGPELAAKVDFNLCRDERQQLHSRDVFDSICVTERMIKLMLLSAFRYDDLEAVLFLLESDQLRTELFKASKLESVAFEAGASMGFLHQLFGASLGSKRLEMEAFETNLMSTHTEHVPTEYLTPVVLANPQELGRILTNELADKDFRLPKISAVLAAFAEKGADIYLAYGAITKGAYFWMDAKERVREPISESLEMLDFVLSSSHNYVNKAFLRAIPNDLIVLHPTSEALFQLKYTLFKDKEAFRRIKSAIFKTQQAASTLSL